MNNLKAFLYKHFNEQQIYLFFAFVALFLPFYITIAVHAFITIKLAIKMEITKAYKKTKKTRFVLAFCGLILAVSLIYGNYIGAVVSLGMLMMFSFAIYYRQTIDKPAFEFLLDTILALSIVAAIVAFIQYIIILRRFNIDTFEIIIFNTPKNRIDSFYFNANYYAMMLEFFVGIAFYKVLNLIKKGFKLKSFICYSVITLINLFMLVLSGCRTAWPAMAAGLVMMLLFNHCYKIFSTFVILGGAGGGFIITHPKYIPRASNITKYLGVRRKIWRAAIACIKDHPLFGEGPLTYMHVWKQYNGHNTQHAHNIFIDPVLSFGIVGIAVFIPYLANCIHRIYVLFKLHLDDSLVALIIGLLVMTIIHGLLDYTIFFVQTGFLMTMIFSSFDIYRSEIDKKLGLLQ